MDNFLNKKSITAVRAFMEIFGGIEQNKASLEILEKK